MNEKLLEFLQGKAPDNCPRLEGKTEESLGFGNLRPIERLRAFVFQCTSAKEVNLQTRYAPATDHGSRGSYFEKGTLPVCRTCPLIEGDVYDESTFQPIRSF